MNSVIFVGGVLLCVCAILMIGSFVVGGVKLLVKQFATDEKFIDDKEYLKRSAA
jgi:hypothetical protein